MKVPSPLQPLDDESLIVAHVRHEIDDARAEGAARLLHMQGGAMSVVLVTACRPWAGGPGAAGASA